LKCAAFDDPFPIVSETILFTTRGRFRLVASSMIVAHTYLTPRREEIAPIGFVAHESYLPWLEVARSDLLKSTGIDYRKLEAEGKYLPVLEWQMRFLRPVRYGDALDIVSSLKSRPPLKFRLDYRILRDGLVVAVGHTLQGFVNRNGWPCRPPEAFSKIIEREFSARGL
jgi:acyl-CoA thioester hydrolase